MTLFKKRETNQVTIWTDYTISNSPLQLTSQSKHHQCVNPKLCLYEAAFPTNTSSSLLFVMTNRWSPQSSITIVPNHQCHDCFQWLITDHHCFQHLFSDHCCSQWPVTDHDCFQWLVTNYHCLKQSQISIVPSDHSLITIIPKNHWSWFFQICKLVYDVTIWACTG